MSNDSTEAARERVARIARLLDPDQLRAWKAAEWDGEYYNPPDLPVWDRPQMRRLDLLDADNAVTWLGDLLIAHLNPPSLWQRIKATFLGDPA